jgi:hypothetical protein
VNIAKMYSQVDDAAADTLAFGAAGPLSRLSGQPLAGGPVGAGLMRAEALPGAAGTAARTPLMAQLIDNPALAGTSGTIGTTAPAVANAASSALGAGTAPLSSLGTAHQRAAAPGQDWSRRSLRIRTRVSATTLASSDPVKACCNGSRSARRQLLIFPMQCAGKPVRFKPRYGDR